MRLKAGDRVDRFEILEPLGEGAYAETYKARDTQSGALVLLKSPNPLLFADPAIHQRFMRESEIARHLNHPGVQRSVDLGENRSEPYLALEYIEGDTLRRWLRRHKTPLSIPQAVQWGTELAEALAYLHHHKIVHRDLKPENIIVTGDGHLKIIDFGTALLTGARRLTWRHLTEALGTPDYMSPEQIQGERGDPRSDIYSWGIMMYEFLTGRVPFEGDNWLAVMAGHLQRHPKPIHELRPEVPGELEAVVLTAMRRYPENRYQSADELLGDLRALNLQETPAAGPAPAETPVKAPVEAPAPAPAPVQVQGHTDAVRPAVPAYGTRRRMSGPPRTSSPVPQAPATSYRPGGGGPAGRAGAPAGTGGVRPTSASARNFSPEKPIGRLPAPASQRSFWVFVSLVAAGFIGVVALVIALSKLLH
ncbi:MAG TPA: serine/threonine-protein kinase [Actinomycetota bacterium]|nr:serine/threonine-protein kinase [Actinomycetota bacterium]